MRAIVLHNPTAGNGDVAAEDLLAALAAGGIAARYCSTRQPDFGDALAEPADLIVAAGGDGTVMKAVGELRARSVPLAILPLGGANNIARSLGIAGDPLQIARAGWRAAVARPLDMGTAAGQWGQQLFVEAVGVGALAEVAAAIAERDVAGPEKSTLARKALLEELGTARPEKLGLTIDGAEVEAWCLLAEIMNTGSIGPRLALAPRPIRATACSISSTSSPRRAQRCWPGSRARCRARRRWRRAGAAASPWHGAGDGCASATSSMDPRRPRVPSRWRCGPRRSRFSCPQAAGVALSWSDDRESAGTCSRRGRGTARQNAGGGRGHGPRAGAAGGRRDPERARPDARDPLQEVVRRYGRFPRPGVPGRPRGRDADPRPPGGALSRPEIIGEEILEEAPGREDDWLWAIDPIDGTTNFINGFPLFAASIGVLHRGRPLVGALWCSTSHALRAGVYHARAGGRLRFEGEPLTREANLAVRRHLAGEPWASAGGALPWEVRKTGSAALECAFVAAGLLRVARFARPHIWDVAGGVALVGAAGGEVRTKTPRGWLPLEQFAAEGGPLRRWRQPVILGEPEAVAILCGRHGGD